MGSSLTGSFDKLSVVLRSKERVGQIPKELLHQPGNTIDIVIEVFWVGKVDL